MYSDSLNADPLKKLQPKAPNPVVINQAKPGQPQVVALAPTTTPAPVKTNLIVYKTEIVKGTNTPNFKYNQQFYYTVNPQVSPDFFSTSAKLQDFYAFYFSSYWTLLKINQFI